MATTPDYTIIAHPRITLAGFAAVLRHVGSPAARQATGCWTAFTAAGVDPAVGLAVFAKESSFGLAGRAAHNRSWGNIRDHDGVPFSIDDAGFRRYPSWAEGARDAARLLALYGHNRIRPGTDTSTVQRFPFVWAPAADHNAPDGYGDFLAGHIARWHALYPPVGPSTAVFHVVQAGETLTSIAAHFHTTWQHLYTVNRALIGSDPSLIHPGQRLRVR